MDEDLDRRLAGLDRAEPVAPAVLDALANAAHREGRSSRRHRLVAGVLSGLLVLGGGIVAGPAAADVARRFLAQANWFPSAGGEILADSEWVDTSAGDLRAYVESIYPEWLELAPSQTRGSVLDGVVAISAANPGLTQEVGLRRMIETDAYCGWAVELIQAHRADDDARYDNAAAIVLAAADWPAIVATDGGGISDRLRTAGESAVAHEWGSWWDVYGAGECDLPGFDPGSAE